MFQTGPLVFVVEDLRKPWDFIIQEASGALIYYGCWPDFDHDELLKSWHLSYSTTYKHPTWLLVTTNANLSDPSIILKILIHYKYLMKIPLQPLITLKIIRDGAALTPLCFFVKIAICFQIGVVKTAHIYQPRELLQEFE